MVEWLVEQVIKGTTTYEGEPLTYDKALILLESNTPKKDFHEKKKIFNSLLSFNGYAKLITK